jgi:hypothetical protein
MKSRSGRAKFVRLSERWKIAARQEGADYQFKEMTNPLRHLAAFWPGRTNFHGARRSKAATAGRTVLQDAGPPFSSRWKQAG